MGAAAGAGHFAKFRLAEFALASAQIQFGHVFPEHVLDLFLLLLGKVDGQFAHNIYSIRTVLQGPYFQRNSTEVNRLPSMLAGLAELIKSQTPTRKLSRVYQGQIDA